MLRLPSSRAVVLSLATALIALRPSVLAQQSTSPSERKVISQVSPVYPDLARKIQMKGTVRLEITVLPNGKMKSASVLGGSPLLVQAAVDAVQKWKWEPMPQETKASIEFHFHP